MFKRGENVHKPRFLMRPKKYYVQKVQRVNKSNLYQLWIIYALAKSSLFEALESNV
jgi:hypothetical protein